MAILELECVLMAKPAIPDKEPHRRVEPYVTDPTAPTETPTIPAQPQRIVTPEREPVPVRR